MLQQTQVKTVIPYWTRWMKQLPSVGALAAAKLDRVLKLWEGLGYYSRARNAMKAAQVIQREHGGRFPNEFEKVIALPGIGRYTAGAICSIAFDQPTPILDGNVIRVLTRLFAIREDPRSGPTNDRLWRIAGEFVAAADRARINGERPCADLNQALMELGALICTPASPKCFQCPIAKHCLALHKNLIEECPKPKAKVTPRIRRFVALALRKDGRYLVQKRPAGQ